MTVTDTRPGAPTEQALTVQYRTTAAHAASALNDKLRDTLVKAVSILATDPYPANSDPMPGDDRLRRIVRATKTLVLVYRADEASLLIEEVRIDPVLPTTDPADSAEQLPYRVGVWERVDMSSLRTPFPPERPGPHGTPPGA
jgi:hypothetical protein